MKNHLQETADNLRGLYHHIAGAFVINTESATETKHIQQFMDAYARLLLTGANASDKWFERKFKALARLANKVIEGIVAGKIQLYVYGWGTA